MTTPGTGPAMPAPGAIPPPGSGGASSVDFGHDSRYMRPDTHRPPLRRAKSRWKKILTFAGRTLLVAGLILAAREAALQASTSRYFELKQIIVNGTSRANQEEIRALASGSLGRNLFEVDLASVRSEAESHPWVKSVLVQRNLPDAIELRITERVPAGVALLSGHAMLVDEEGTVLGECGSVVAECDFPIMRGFDRLPADLRATRIAMGVSAMREVERLSSDLSRSISEVDLSNAYRIEVYRHDGDAPIYLSPESFGRNLENYRSIQDDIHERYARLDYVDLRFRGRIAVMPAEMPAASSPPVKPDERDTRDRKSGASHKESKNSKAFKEAAPGKGAPEATPPDVVDDEAVAEGDGLQ